jgi:streptogramin lyase
VATLLFAAGLGALAWHLGGRSEPGFVEYPMLVKTDIPTAVAAAPNGAVWFTIEFSDAIAVFRDGKIERFRKGSQNLEPLGLAVDATNGAWYTDTPMRVISHISNGGVTAILAEAGHDAEERVAPLAERDKVMEALEDDVLFVEMRAVAGVLQPVPGNRFLRVGNACVRDVVQPLINPGLKRT